MHMSDFVKATRESGGTLLGAGFVLLFTVPMVRIMIQSGVNANELASMPISMARWVAASVGDVYPVFAPTVGALGAFLAGSNTVSNLMLSQYQYSVAQALGVSGATMRYASLGGARSSASPRCGWPLRPERVLQRPLDEARFFVGEPRDQLGEALVG